MVGTESPNMRDDSELMSQPAQAAVQQPVSHPAVHQSQPDHATQSPPLDQSSGSDAEFSFDDFAPATVGGGNIDMLLKIPVSVQVVLGSATIVMSELANIKRGAVIPLNQHVGEPVDIVVNGCVVARGEIVVLEEDDTRFGISLTELTNS